MLTLDKRIERLEQSLKENPEQCPDCICFPQSEQPFSPHKRIKNSLFRKNARSMAIASSRVSTSTLQSGDSRPKRCAGAGSVRSTTRHGTQLFLQGHARDILRRYRGLTIWVRPACIRRTAYFSRKNGAIVTLKNPESVLESRA